MRLLSSLLSNALAAKIGEAFALVRLVVVVVRGGGVEPPTFRFSGELPSPRKSTTDRLTSLDASPASFGVHGQRQPSTAVVSGALARPPPLSVLDPPVIRAC
jgi:hypothetical protein